MTERRIRALEIDGDTWLDAWRRLGQGRDTVECAIPADAHCVGVYIHPTWTHRMVMWVESATFDPILEGQMPPRWDLWITLHSAPHFQEPLYKISVQPDAEAPDAD